MSETIYIEEVDMYVCINCGNFGKAEADIKHHDTCSPGEAKKWEKFYAAKENNSD